MKPTCAPTMLVYDYTKQVVMLSVRAKKNEQSLYKPHLSSWTLKPSRFWWRLTFTCVLDSCFSISTRRVHLCERSSRHAANAVEASPYLSGGGGGRRSIFDACSKRVKSCVKLVTGRRFVSEQMNE